MLPSGWWKYGRYDVSSSLFVYSQVNQCTTTSCDIEQGRLGAALWRYWELFSEL